MKHISPYINKDSIISSINENLIGKETMIANAISYESIINEASYLDKIESLIPSELSLQVQLEIIIDKGARAITEYYNQLSNKSQFTNYINEQFDLSATDVQSAMSNYSQTDWNDVMKNIKSTTDIPTPRSPETANVEGEGGIDTEHGVIPMLQSLGNALTEGGSPIGILHLILDIVGLFGDAFGPVGLIADLINGIIYLVRGKWLLALISFIGAMIPFAGNALGMLFKSSKAGKSVGKITSSFFKTGSVDATAKAAVNAGPEAIKGVEYIAKSSKTAVPAASRMIRAFFNDFLGKMVGWVPIIGKPLKKLFAKISDLLTVFERKTLKFADDIPKIMTKREVKVLSGFLDASSQHGSKIIAAGDSIIVKSASGKVISKIPSSVFKNSGFLINRYGKLIPAPIAAKMDPVKFYKGMSDGLKAVNPMYKVANKIGGSVIFVKVKVPAFIGKEIIKLIDPGKSSSAYTDQEAEAIGNAAIQNAMKKRIDRELKEDPNAVYSVPYIDAIEDNESQKALQKGLDGYAKQFGLPGIADVVYAKNQEKDKMPQDVKDWYNKTWEDKQGYLNQMEKNLIGNKMSESMKHVIPFNKFSK